MQKRQQFYRLRFPILLFLMLLLAAPPSVSAQVGEWLSGTRFLGIFPAEKCAKIQRLEFEDIALAGSKSWKKWFANHGWVEFDSLGRPTRYWESQPSLDNGYGHGEIYEYGQNGCVNIYSIQGENGPAELFSNQTIYCHDGILDSIVFISTIGGRRGYSWIRNAQTNALDEVYWHTNNPGPDGGIVRTYRDSTRLVYDDQNRPVQIANNHRRSLQTPLFVFGYSHPDSIKIHADPNSGLNELTVTLNEARLPEKMSVWDHRKKPRILSQVTFIYQMRE